MTAAAPGNIHATALLVAGVGILIRGPSRSGKSALAISLLRRADALKLPAFLVADDQVLVEATADGLLARAPASIRGRIEISGVGILAERSAESATIGLVVDLREPGALPRLPEDATAAIAGASLRRVFLPAREAAFGADVLLTLLAPHPAG